MNFSGPFLSQYPQEFSLRTMSGGRYCDQRTEINTVSALASIGHPSVTLPFPLQPYPHSFPRPEATPKNDCDKKIEVPARYTRNGRKRAIPFPLKLMQVLSDDEYSHIISWMPSGKSFVILRPKAFVTEVLPSNFKSAQYTSFTRKLARWGFVRCEEGTGEFHHPKFRKGRFDLVEKMTPAYGATSAKEAKEDNKSSIDGVKELVVSTTAPVEGSAPGHEKDEMSPPKVATIEPTKHMSAPTMNVNQAANPRSNSIAATGVSPFSKECLVAAHHNEMKNLRMEMEAFRLRQSIHAFACSQNVTFPTGRYPMLSTSIDMSKLMLLPPSLLGGLGSSTGRSLAGLELLQSPPGSSMAAGTSYPFLLDAARSSASTSMGRNIDPSLLTNLNGATTFQGS